MKIIAIICPTNYHNAADIIMQTYFP